MEALEARIKQLEKQVKDLQEDAHWISEIEACFMLDRKPQYFKAMRNQLKLKIGRDWRYKGKQAQYKKAMILHKLAELNKMIIPID